MPRKLRVEYPGAVYHVMSRADGQGDIFLSDVDRHDFLKTLAEACAKTGFQVHAYCLMRNHFHLVAETPNANLVAGMRWLLSTYTIRLNHRHKLFGHVFSGRYKALVVDGSANGYLKSVCDYVHLNPVRAKLLTPEEPLCAFSWSSFPEYLKAPGRRAPWLRVDRLFGEMSIPQDTPAGRRQFALRMEERRAQEAEGDWKAVRRGWCLGDAAFRRELLAQMDGQMGEHHYGPERQESAEQKAERLLQAGLKQSRWTEEDLRLRRKSDGVKIRLAAQLRQE